MWMTSEGIDLVWAHPGAEGISYHHILTHELGHMVNGDEPDPIDLKDAMRLMMSMCSHTSKDLWAASMCRTDFSEEREQRAEDFGYFAEGWLMRARPASNNLLMTNMRECLETRSRNEYW